MKLNSDHYSKFKTTKANNSAWIGFSPLSWFKWIKSNASLKLENIDISDLPSSKVSRKELFDMAKNPDIDTLICCISILAWGGMNRKHGLSLIENYAEWIDVAENVRKGTLRREGAYDAFSALRKKSRLPGMGPAYFTKLIFFLASQDKQVGYIMDQWTATSANLLFDEKVVITQLQKSKSKSGKTKLIEVVTDKNTKHNYESFCKCVEFIAAELSFTPSLIEEMMFSEGRKKGEWRNYLVEQRMRITMSFIKPEEINKVKLTELLTNAAIEVIEEDDPNKIYLKGLDFGIWITFDDENKHLKLYTFVQCKEDAPLDDLAFFSEECNKAYKLVQFTSSVYEDGRGYINGSYYIYYNFGLIAPQLIYTIRKFSSIFVSAIREKDSDDKFFS